MIFNSFFKFSKGAHSNLLPQFTIVLIAVNCKNLENMPFMNEWMLEVMKSVAVSLVLQKMTGLT